MSYFSNRLLAWFEEHGRKDLPWQIEPTPYRPGANATQSEAATAPTGQHTPPRHRVIEQQMQVIAQQLAILRQRS